MAQLQLKRPTELHAAAAAAAGSQQRLIKASEPVALFQGYSAVRGQGMNTAVKGTSELVGGTSFVKCDICFSSAQLVQSLNVDQSLSVGYPPLGTISEKLQFARSVSVTSTTTFIVVYAHHTKGQEVITDVQGFQPDVTLPTTQNELAQFVQYYGDSYLSSRTTGGEYYAVYSYYSDSIEEQTEFSVDIQAAGILSGMSVDANLQVKINSLNSSKKRRISLEQFMSGVANPTFPTSDKITEFALNFPRLDLTAPTIIHWTTSGYENVPGIGDKFNTIAANRRLLASTETSTTLSKLKALQGSIDSIKKVYNLYGGYNRDTKLDQVKAQADEDERTVTSLKSAYLEDPTKPLQAAAPLELISIKNGIPSLQYEVQVVPLIPNAHQAPTPFDDVPDAKAYFQHRQKIESVQLLAGPRLVSCLIVTYAGESTPPQTVMHGTLNHDHDSQYTRTLQVLPGHFIGGVTGLRGLVPDMAPSQVVTGLNIFLDTAIGIRSGGTKGDYFSWYHHDAFLMGFRGSYGWFIDDLQLVCASFSPASWSPYN